MMTDPLTLVRELAARHGFDVVGVTSGAPLTDALDALVDWCAQGYEGSMGYLSRDPPQRADPRTLQREVRAVVTVAVNYWQSAPEFEAEGRYGRVARYAWGRDYHDIVLPRLDAFGRDLRAALPGATKVRSACDHSPFLERAAAVRAGLGFFGKNTCLLLPRRGSWYFLGEVLLDVELPATAPAGADHCGTCTDCLGACPTDAFPAPFVLDANRCISYLTIEHPGAIPSELRSKLGPWVFGCDVCQDVCPFNRFASPAPWPEFAASEGVGPRLDLLDVLALEDDEAFARRFAGTPLLRPRRRGLLRNAAIAARNIGADAAVPLLERRTREESEPWVRSAALWALAGLDSARARQRAVALARDPDAEVRAEAEALL
ncbi:MAG: tRNA epoxyqueuosine(34) reductase QueG [Planctomycetota bacterium]|nr:tRNA epoxyqueuosine(34) reductase QueG [Planctomycetota bacterium]